MAKQRCSICGGWIYVQEGKVYVCEQCKNPVFLAEEPPEGYQEGEKPSPDDQKGS